MGADCHLHSEALREHLIKFPDETSTTNWGRARSIIYDSMITSCVRHISDSSLLRKDILQIACLPAREWKHGWRQVYSGRSNCDGYLDSENVVPAQQRLLVILPYTTTRSSNLDNARY